MPRIKKYLEQNYCMNDVDPAYPQKSGLVEHGKILVRRSRFRTPNGTAQKS
jgi:hypothetical protein